MSVDLATITDQLRAERDRHAQIVAALNEAITALAPCVVMEIPADLFALVDAEPPADDRGAGADGDPTPVAEEPAGGQAPADVLDDTAPAPEPEIDYERVAEVATAAIEAGRSTTAAVAEAFGCSVDAARQRIMRARRRGIDIPPAPIRPAGLPRIDFAEVARVAREAIQADVSMRSAVAERFGWTVHTADLYILRAREKGHEIPPAKVGRKRSKPVGTVHQLPTAKAATVALVCDDCGAEFPTDRYLDLRDHVTMEHNRKVRDGERTPRPREATA